MLVLNPQMLAQLFILYLKVCQILYNGTFVRYKEKGSENLYISIENNRFIKAVKRAINCKGQCIFAKIENHMLRGRANLRFCKYS